MVEETPDESQAIAAARRRIDDLFRPLLEEADRQYEADITRLAGATGLPRALISAKMDQIKATVFDAIWNGIAPGFTVTELP